SAPNRTVQAGSAGTISQILFLRGEYAEALRWADECLEGNEAIGNVSGFTAPAAVALAARVTLGLAADTERYLELIEQGLASARSRSRARCASGTTWRAPHASPRAARRPRGRPRTRAAHAPRPRPAPPVRHRRGGRRGAGRKRSPASPALHVLRHQVGVDAADEARDVGLDLRPALGREVHAAPDVLGRREGELAEAVVVGPVAAQALVDDVRHVARGGVVAERQRDVALEPVRAERGARHPGRACEAREELPAGRAPAQAGRRGGRALHVLGRDVRSGASDEA